MRVLEIQNAVGPSREWLGTGLLRSNSVGRRLDDVVSDAAIFVASVSTRAFLWSSRRTTIAKTRPGGSKRHAADHIARNRTAVPQGLLGRFGPHAPEFVLFAVALGIRFLFLVQFADAPSFAIPLVDAEIYDRAARSLVGGGGLTEAFFFQPFFYPFYLALVYAATGGSILAAKVIQAALGAFTVLCVTALAGRLYDRRTGLMAGGMTAVYGPLIFFEAELIAAGWAAFWSVLLVLIFSVATDRGSVRLAATAGLCGGLAVLTRPTFLPFVVVTAAWMCWTLFRIHRRALVNTVGATVGAFLLVTLPVAWLSLKATGEFHFLPASGGLNLHLGNNPDRCETLTIRPGQAWHELVTSPAEAGAKGLWEEDRHFRSRVFRFVVERPGAFVTGVMSKAVEFVNSREIPRNFDIYLFRRWSSLLSVTVWRVGPFGFPFGLLLPLATLGVMVGWRRLSVPLVLFLFLYPSAVIAVFVSARYRIPVIPILVVPAAVGLAWLMDSGRVAIQKRLAMVGVAAAAVLLCVFPGPFCQEQDLEGEYWFVVAAGQVRNGDRAAAEKSLHRAVALEPDYFEARLQLGSMLLADGKAADALPHLEWALAQRPGMAMVHGELGLALARLGRLAGAVFHLERATELDPSDVSNLNNLGVLMARAGDLEAARVWFSRAVELEPDSEKAKGNLEHVQRQLTAADRE